MHTANLITTSYNNITFASQLPPLSFSSSLFLLPLKKTPKKRKMKKKRSKPYLPLPPLPSPSDKNQSSSTSSTSSSFSTFPSPSPSPSPSPYHFASSVPFSWERKPGVPFTPLHPNLPPPRYASSRPLPLPPSKVISLDNGNLATIRRRRRGLEIFLALIGRLAGMDPYCSCKSVTADDVANREAKTASWTSRRRHRR